MRSSKRLGVYRIVERFRRRASFRGSQIASESTNLRQRILVRFAVRLREREAPRALIPQSRARVDRTHAYGGRYRGPCCDRDRRRCHPRASLSRRALTNSVAAKRKSRNVAQKQIASASGRAARLKTTLCKIVCFETGEREDL